MDSILNIKLFVFLVIVTSIFLIYIVYLIKKDTLELKYALLWIFTGIALILIAVFPSIPAAVSHLLGIGVIANAVYLIGIFLLIMVVFGLTIALSRASRRITKLSQELALLKQKVDNLDK